MRTADRSSPTNVVLQRARRFLQLPLPHVAGTSSARASRSSLEKTIWASPAGKKVLSSRLVKLIPPHRTYVEPFAGSAALFFRKPPSEVEVLGDADPEIAFAFKVLTTITDRDLDALRKKEWAGHAKLFDSLRKATPQGKVDRLYKFLYLSHFAYASLRGRGYNAAKEGIVAHTVQRIERHRDRLRGVKVHAGHYADLVKEFDGKDTFFYFDPPYPGHNVAVGEATFDESEFRKILDGIKGKFLITYGARGALDTSGFQVRKIRTRRTMGFMRGGDRSPTLTQLLIANYGIARKSLGPYVLDEVVAAIELDETTATDLELAKVLAKALTQKVSRPEIAALEQALDQFEAVGDDCVDVFARGLLPISDRLVAALDAAAPAAAAALDNARPALAALAKAHSSPPLVGRTTADAPQLSALLDKRIPLLKTSEERYVLGIVLEPDTVDSQQDIYDANTVRDAAHRFMEEFQNVGFMHRDLVNGRVKILESYLAPSSFTLDGTQVRKGTWLLAVRVLDDELWAQIKSGELTGFSMGGSAVRSPEPA